MKLIIGGAYQGKLAYAKKEYGVTEGWLDGRTCRPGEIWHCRGIYCFHEYVKRMLPGKAATADAEDAAWLHLQNDDLSSLEQQAHRFVTLLLQENPDLLIVSDELGCGVVPVEKTDRLWREATGRICTELAAQAEEVVRVTCGLGLRLK